MLDVLVRLHHQPEWRDAWRQRLHEQAPALGSGPRRVSDLVYLATYDLTTLPATTVTAGELSHVIVADKGEMGVRAVREQWTDEAGAFRVALRVGEERVDVADPLAVWIRGGVESARTGAPLRWGFDPAARQLLDQLAILEAAGVAG